jgi:hypothetical protein
MHLKSLFPKHLTAWAMAIGGLLCSCNGAESAESTASSSLQLSAKSALPAKPAWLADLSLGLKESHDDDLFLSGVDARFLPASYTVPAGSVAALKGRSSWVTTVSPKIGIDVAPLTGNEDIKTLSLGYCPDFAIYHDAPSESYDAHRVVAAVRAKAEPISLTADNSFVYVDGSDMGPLYPGGLLSSLGIAAPRERREQIQDRAAFALEYDWSRWFVRPTASFLYYDLMTQFKNVTGYMNYVDRYDVNGGADFGYNLAPQMAVSLGYRYGHQYQQQLDFSPYNSSSDYQRVLLGFSGNPWKWLEVNLQGGPDFREYPADTPTRITPVSDKHTITYYGEAGLTARLTAKDILAFKYKQFLWVSSIGKVPYFDSSYALSYQRSLTDTLKLELAGKLASADYSLGNLSTCRRDDWQYTIGATLSYSLSAHASLSIAYSLDLGRNAEDGVVNPQTREYDRNTISLGALLKF